MRRSWVGGLLLGTVLLAGCDSGGSLTGGVGRDGTTPATSSGSVTSPEPGRGGPSGSSVSRSVAATDPDATVVLILRVIWVATPSGRQLQVFPTAAGRSDTFPAAAARAWQEVLRDAPGAGSPGMYDQFLCHWNFARVVDPDKPSWDLETWRPAVGYAATVAALCNPGGGADQ